jgi:hypothetical protein
MGEIDRRVDTALVDWSDPHVPALPLMPPRRMARGIDADKEDFEASISAGDNPSHGSSHPSARSATGSRR